jgi:soluble lytic murein transglycosylase-like protein
LDAQESDPRRTGKSASLAIGLFTLALNAAAQLPSTPPDSPPSPSTVTPAAAADLAPVSVAVEALLLVQISTAAICGGPDLGEPAPGSADPRNAAASTTTVAGAEAPAEPAAARAASLPPAAVAAPPAPAGPPLGFDRALGVPHTPFGKQIYRVAVRYALNPLLVAAVVEAESDFNPRAVSRKGACGLMQMMPATARRFGYRRRDLFNPRKNLEAGARYLRLLVNRFGDDALRVLAAYNAGEGSVERFGGMPPFPETRDYVQHIFTRLGFAVLVPALDAVAPAGGR